MSLARPLCAGYGQTELVSGFQLATVDLIVQKGIDGKVKTYLTSPGKSGNLTAGALGVWYDLAYISP